MLSSNFIITDFDSRPFAMARTGIVPVIVEIATQTTVPMLKSKAVGLLCCMLDIRSLQVEAVQLGALVPLLEVTMSPESRLIDVTSAVAALHCCASNPRLMDNVVEAGAVKALCDLSMSVVDVHSPEILLSFTPLRMKKLPLMIRFLCHTTNCVLIHQMCLKRWKKVVEEGCQAEGVGGLKMCLDIFQSECNEMDSFKQALLLSSQWLKSEIPKRVSAVLSYFVFLTVMVCLVSYLYVCLPVPPVTSIHVSLLAIG